MKKNGCLKYHDRYFEHTGNTNSVFFYFSHPDFEKGMKVKKKIENLSFTIHILLIFILLTSIGLFFYKKKYGFTGVVIFILLFLTTIFNNPVHFYKLKKCRRYI